MERVLALIVNYLETCNSDASYPNNIVIAWGSHNHKCVLVVVVIASIGHCIRFSINEGTTIT
jgi:hypothetical protein